MMVCFSIVTVDVCAGMSAAHKLELQEWSTPLQKNVISNIREAWLSNQVIHTDIIIFFA